MKPRRLLGARVEGEVMGGDALMEPCNHLLGGAAAGGCELGAVPAGV
jgi:hypothetical protein